AYVGFGAELSTFVGHDSERLIGFGLTKLIAGGVFSCGLMMIILAGAELFTGNMLITIAVFEKRTTYYKMTRNWFVVYFSNFVGAAIIAYLVFMAKTYTQNHNQFGVYALQIAQNKVSLPFTEIFIRGILCNWLVCIAIWMAYSSRSVIGKIAALFFPITAFAALGYEHCVANMFFFTKGMLLKSVPEIADIVVATTGKTLDNMTVQAIVFNNLIPSTLGNIVGATLFVGVTYWYVYLKK
ncbi:MAG: formate/nitrite transporter family protein, partial [Thermoguttaceae bacterium]